MPVIPISRGPRPPQNALDLLPGLSNTDPASPAVQARAQASRDRTAMLATNREYAAELARLYSDLSSYDIPAPAPLEETTA